MCFVQFSRPISTGKLLWITHCNVLHFWSRKWLFWWYYPFSIRRALGLSKYCNIISFCHVVKTLRGKDSDWMLSASQLRSWPKDEKIAAYLLQTWRSSSEVKLVSIVSLFIKLLAPSFPLWPHLFLLLLLFFKICFVFCSLHSLFFHFDIFSFPLLDIFLVYVCVLVCQSSCPFLHLCICCFQPSIVPPLLCQVCSGCLFLT